MTAGKTTSLALWQKRQQESSKSRPLTIHWRCAGPGQESRLRAHVEQPDDLIALSFHHHYFNSKRIVSS